MICINCNSVIDGNFCYICDKLITNGTYKIQQVFLFRRIS